MEPPPSVGSASSFRGSQKVKRLIVDNIMEVKIYVLVSVLCYFWIIKRLFFYILDFENNYKIVKHPNTDG